MWVANVIYSIYHLFDVLVVDSIFSLLSDPEDNKAHDNVKDGHYSLDLHLIETDPLLLMQLLSLHYPVEEDEWVTSLQQPKSLHVF